MSHSRIFRGGFGPGATTINVISLQRCTDIGSAEFAPVVFAGMDDAEADLEGLTRIPGVEVVRSGAFDRHRAGLAGSARAGA